MRRLFISIIIALLLAALLPASAVRADDPCGPGWPGSGYWYQPAEVPTICAQTTASEAGGGSLAWVWVHVCGTPQELDLYPSWRRWPDLAVLYSIPEMPIWHVVLTDKQPCAELGFYAAMTKRVPDLALKRYPWPQHFMPLLH